MSARTLTASNQLPCRVFAFNEARDRLYGGDAESTYFDLDSNLNGHRRWSPLHRQAGARPTRQVLRQIWRAYYTETTSRCEGKVTMASVHCFRIARVASVLRTSFTGFMKGAMELVCVIRSGDAGAPFRGSPFAATGVAEPQGNSESFAGAHNRRSHVGAWTFHREVEVLHLIAKGKTSKKSVLGIRSTAVHAPTHTTRSAHAIALARCMARRTSRSIVLRDSGNTRGSRTFGRTRNVISSREGAPSSPPPRATRSSNARRSHPRCA